MTSKAERKLVRAVFWFIAAIVTFIPAVIWEGYCLSTVWSWLVVPSFDVPPIPTKPMACACFFVMAFRAKYGIKHETHEAGTVVLLQFIGPLFLLGIAWVLSHFLVGA